MEWSTVNGEDQLVVVRMLEMLIIDYLFIAEKRSCFQVYLSVC